MYRAYNKLAVLLWSLVTLQIVRATQGPQIYKWTLESTKLPSYQTYMEFITTRGIFSLLNLPKLKTLFSAYVKESMEMATTQAVIDEVLGEIYSNTRGQQ